MDPIDDLAQRWRSTQDASSTISLCEALSNSGQVRTTLVQQVADFAQVKFASNVPVLVAVARMYMRSHQLSEAQSVLVAAGKIAPRDGHVYRVLGEVLIRRGDAERAEKVLERAVQFGLKDNETLTWLERTRVFKPMQAKAGVRAVAAEVARTAPLEDEADDQPDDEETEIRLPAPKTPPPPSNPIQGPADRRYPMNAPTVDPFTPLAGSPSSAPPPRPVTLPLKPAPAVEAMSPPMPVAANGARHAPAEAPAPFRSAAAPGVPDARDVLDALALAGVFEGSSGGPAVQWERQKRRRRRGTLPLVALTLLFVGGAIGGFRYVKLQREKAHTRAETTLAQIEVDLNKSQANLLPNVEAEFSQVFDLDSRSERAAVDWLRERALSGLLKGGGDVAFEDGLTRAREVKVKEENLVFAQVASFLFQGDTVGAASLLSKWDGPSAQDPWYQLLAGAALERAGDSRARDRFEAATKLDGDLVIAHVGLVRSTAIDGDAAKAMELAKAFRAKWPDRIEGQALVALAWARDPARSEQPPPEAAETITRQAELPLGLRFVPHAVAALEAVDKHDFEGAKEQIRKGLVDLEGPGPASWFGIIALQAGDETLAQKAALAAVGFSAVYPPARVLAARVALLGNRLDEALKATEDLDATSPDVAVVRAATAYERVDATSLVGALEAIPGEARKLPFLNALNVAADALGGRANLPPDRILDMSDDEAPWADLVAMDLALDAGDLGTAGQIAEKWKGTEARPLRALRLSRLARYQGKLEAADAASQNAMVGTITTRTLMERVFVLVARDKSHDASQLLAKYPLVLGSLAGWLGGYVSASSGKIDDARGKTASLEPPPNLAPVPARVITAVALGAMRDHRRGPDYLRDLFAAGIVNPDTAAAASALGLKAPERRPVRR